MSPSERIPVPQIQEKPLVYVAFSKHLFYYRDFISAFVLKSEAVPLNPFSNFGYFLNDLADRDLVRNANNNLVIRANEVWVFGQISNGVLAEIALAHSQGKPIRFFAITKPHAITECMPGDLELEADLKPLRGSWSHLAHTLTDTSTTGS